MDPSNSHNLVEEEEIITLDRLPEDVLSQILKRCASCAKTIATISSVSKKFYVISLEELWKMYCLNISEEAFDSVVKYFGDGSSSKIKWKPFLPSLHSFEAQFLSHEWRQFAKLLSYCPGTSRGYVEIFDKEKDPPHVDLTLDVMFDSHEGFLDEKFVMEEMFHIDCAHLKPDTSEPNHYVRGLVLNFETSILRNELIARANDTNYWFPYVRCPFCNSLVLSGTNLMSVLVEVGEIFFCAKGHFHGWYRDIDWESDYGFEIDEDDVSFGSYDFDSMGSLGESDSEMEESEHGSHGEDSQDEVLEESVDDSGQSHQRPEMEESEEDSGGESDISEGFFSTGNTREAVEVLISNNATETEFTMTSVKIEVGSLDLSDLSLESDSSLEDLTADVTDSEDDSLNSATEGSGISNSFTEEGVETFGSDSGLSGSYHSSEFEDIENLRTESEIPSSGDDEESIGLSSEDAGSDEEEDFE